MKKVLLVSVVVALSLPLNSFADTIFGVYAGAYIWQAEASSSMSAPEYGNYEIDVEGDKNNNSVMYIAVEHAIPLFPNIRLTQSSIEHDGSGSYRAFSLEGTADGTLDLSHTDVTLYYEVLDNFISLDMGLTARIFDGNISGIITIEDYYSPGMDLEFPLNTPYKTTLAALYIKAQVDLPFTGLAVGLDANVGDIGDESGADLNAYMQYESTLGFGLSAGYRSLTADLESINKSPKVTVFSEVDIDGPYLSIFFHL